MIPQIVCSFIITFCLVGCAGYRGAANDGVKMEARRFFLYDKYTEDLRKKDAVLKDAFAFSVATDEKIVAITFDDGPSEHAAKILSTLKMLDAPATFFLIAENVTTENIKPYNAPLFRTEPHGYVHEHFLSLDKNRCFSNVSSSRSAFEKTGLKPEYFRPPYGEITNDLKSALVANRLTGILWSLDSLDWNRLSGDSLVDRVTANVQSGDIILFHERKWTAEALEKIVSGIRKKGFRIVSLEHLLTFPKSISP